MCDTTLMIVRSSFRHRTEDLLESCDGLVASTELEPAADCIVGVQVADAPARKDHGRCLDDMICVLRRPFRDGEFSGDEVGVKNLLANAELESYISRAGNGTKTIP